VRVSKFWHFRTGPPAPGAGLTGVQPVLPLTLGRSRTGQQPAIIQATRDKTYPHLDERLVQLVWRDNGANILPIASLLVWWPSYSPFPISIRTRVTEVLSNHAAETWTTSPTANARAEC
jgi:hypothetical protein